MTAPLVEVLMSTYNGSAYVADQIDSILAQSHEPFRLLIRDDGSTDDTRAILARYASDSRIRVLGGGNLGLPEAFFHLIDIASDDADLYALADQDDVWMPEKIARAVAALSAIRGPALYCARVLVVDEQLRPLYPHELPRRGPSFANALVQNIALGCTVVINSAARDVLRGRWPAECVMHDAWMYLVIAGTGTVVYDEEVVLQYRQHARNSVGMGSSAVARLAGRVRRQLSPGGAGKHTRQDLALAHSGVQLKPCAAERLAEFLRSRETTWLRTRYAVRGPAHRQSPGSNLVLKGLQLLGRV
ncbi:MAG: glycosyltransferase family 2 protein [Actinobacteria bacterium]|nr:glycosyltransferase family 2 protein [Actinomycetota bacterium]MCA1720558.1 glycosyltransferase family 2 protein [Actinomycetota bacterium]